MIWAKVSLNVFRVGWFNFGKGLIQKGTKIWHSFQEKFCSDQEVPCPNHEQQNRMAPASIVQDPERNVEGLKHSMGGCGISHATPLVVAKKVW